jgi:hypothetical protein
MKHYLYVSDSKVEMFYSQIPDHKRRSIAATLKLDLKVLGIDLTMKPSEDTKFSKLKVLDEYVQAHEDVGTVDQSGQFFKGVMDLRWGIWGDLNRPEDKIVYFSGMTGMTALGLGGSPRHLIGSAPGAVLDGMGGKSNLLRILGALADDPDFAELRRQERDAWVAHAVASSTDKMPGPPQRLGFLARRLYHEAGSPSVLLGTPVYVTVEE